VGKKERNKMSEEIVKLGSDSPVAADVIAIFNDVLLQMYDYRKELVEAGDWDALCRGLVNLNDFKSNLTMLIQAIESDIYDTLPEKKVTIEGVGIIEKRRSSSKKWDSEGLLNSIVNEKLNNGTGEITPGDVFDLVETLKRVMPITPSFGWRVNELKKENIDTSNYCDVTWGRPTVSVIPYKEKK
jgi:hypothetical protein